MFTVDGERVSIPTFFFESGVVVKWISRLISVISCLIGYHLSGFFLPHMRWNTQNSHQFRLRWGWNWSKHKVPWRCLSITGWTEPIETWFFPVLVDITPEGYSDLKPMNFNYQLSKVGRGPYVSNMSRWKPQELPTILSQPQIYRTASMPLPWTVAISRRHWVAWCSYNSIK